MCSIIGDHVCGKHGIYEHVLAKATIVTEE